MEDDDFQDTLEEVDERARRAFRMAITFIHRLLRDNDLHEK